MQNIVYTREQYAPHFNFWEDCFSRFRTNFVYRQNAFTKGEYIYQKTTFTNDTKNLQLLYESVQNQKSGIFIFIVAALGIILNRYSRNKHVIIKSPPIQSARSPQQRKAVPLLLNIEGEQNLRTNLNNLLESVKGAYQYQDFPLNLISDEEIFDSNIFISFDGLHDQLEFHDFDLYIRVLSFNNPLLLDFTYNSAFDDRVIHDLNGHLMNLLSSFNEMDKKVGELDSIGEVDRNRIVQEYSISKRNRKNTQTVIELFQHRVDVCPDAVALQYNTVQLTYTQLNSKVNLLAHHLRRNGATNNELVGIMLDRSHEIVITILAILKAGAAFLAIPPDYPKERKMFMLEDAAIQLLITDSNYLFDQGIYKGKLFVFDKEFSHLKDCGEFETVIDFSDLAYLIYTSGTTGKPKGTLLEHGALANMCSDQIMEFGITKSDKVLQFASISFDASISEIFMALCSGARLVMIDQSVILDKEHFVSFLHDHQITVVTLPPSYLRGLSNERLKSLKVLITAGERPYLDQALQLSKQLNYFNGYGPTEYTVCATIQKVEEKSHKVGKVVSIGKPISNTYIYILDESMNLQPLGVDGDIYIGGIGLARGYLNLPQLTSEKFVPSPFRNGERIYKSGDVGRWLLDGNIEFSGRLDDQVKVRGYRIELSEIEQFINEHADVLEAFVACELDELGENYLHGYIKLKQPLTWSLLRNYLLDKVPEYMIPTEFSEVDHMPLLSSGKVDRHVLMNLKKEKKSDLYVSARNETESQLVRIWEEVLGKTPIGIDDNFFELGGHSLKAARMVSRIYEDLGLKVGLKTLFSQSTIRGLSESMPKFGVQY